MPLGRLQNLARFARDFGTLSAWDLLRQKATGGKGTVHCVRVRGMRTPICFRKGTTDLTIMRQIFKLKECLVDLIREPTTIIDGGAHVGYSSLLFANTYPQAQSVPKSRPLR